MGLQGPGWRGAAGGGMGPWGGTGVLGRGVGALGGGGAAGRGMWEPWGGRGPWAEGCTGDCLVPRLHLSLEWCSLPGIASASVTP